MGRKPSVAATFSLAATAARGTAARKNQSRRGRSPWGDRDYEAAEAEFLKAAEAYRQEHKRAFLRATDYLAVALALGYRKGGDDGGRDGGG